LSALLAIVLIDLVLAGDNTIVIPLSARNLPLHLQKRAVMWGTVGAIVVRSTMTVGVVWLLKIPGLMLAGGIGLLWITYKLLADQNGDEHDGSVVGTFWGAMVLKLVERFPIIIRLGAAVLAFTAAKMIVNEGWLSHIFQGEWGTLARWSTYAVSVAGVLLAGSWAERRAKAANDNKFVAG